MSYGPHTRNPYETDEWGQEPERCHHCERTELQVALGHVHVQNGAGYEEFTYCNDCATDELTECPDCKAVIFQEDGVRVFSAPPLYCHQCSLKYPWMQAGSIAELRADEQRDNFEQRRR